MNVAFDIDGTLDAFPREFQSTISAYNAAGHRVLIITGVENDTVAKADLDAKRQYLTSMGVGKDLYDQLIVCPTPHDENKAQAIKENDVAMLFDNNKTNAKAAKKYCAVLVLWNARED